MEYKDIQGWFDYSDLFELALKNLNGTFVEVGCWRGKSSAYLGKIIKESNKNIQLFCIDIWDDGIEKSFHKHSNAYQQYIQHLETPLYNEFIDNMTKCGVIDMITPIKNDSVESSKLFDDGSIDFCFIDGDHSYEGCKRDIHAWFPKMKKGGIFAGHDYTNAGARKVKMAVDEFAKNYNLTVKKNNKCWVIYL